MERGGRQGKKRVNVRGKKKMNVVTKLSRSIEQHKPTLLYELEHTIKCNIN